MREPIDGIGRALASSGATLGLPRGTVGLAEADASWPAVFEVVASALDVSLDGLDAAVEHIGSTAVPGLAAKPLIDVGIGVGPDVAVDDAVAVIERTGFVFESDEGNFGGLFFTLSIPGDPAVVLAHLHLVERSNFQWRWYLGFRDALRRDADLRADYERIKRRAAERHRRDRVAYTEDKADWILRLVSALDAGNL